MDFHEVHVGFCCQVCCQSYHPGASVKATLKEFLRLEALRPTTMPNNRKKEG
jgi:hypothetical protein